MDKNGTYEAFFDIFLFKSLQFQSPLKSSAECSVLCRGNLRKSWNHPEILILHKLSGKLLSPWKLTTEDKPQTLIDLESGI